MFRSLRGATKGIPPFGRERGLEGPIGAFIAFATGQPLETSPNGPLRVPSGTWASPNPLKRSALNFTGLRPCCLKLQVLTIAFLLG